MPYIVLGIGVLIAIIAGLKFFSTARPEQIKSFLSLVAALIYSLILLYFAVTTRFAVSIAGVVIALPFILRYIKNKNKKAKEKDSDQAPKP